ncbi:MAG: class I SAM-dependent methyltransferase [Chloroflexi bacterium]|nr:class I SAM-dependent methyltransferase [Chloroflexota bacterium]
MDDSTIRRLNQINRDFYRITADEFDQTRGTPWPGWERLLPHLRTPLSALDVGCGNGRFGLFLYERLVTPSPAPPPAAPETHPPPSTLFYHGLDYSSALLERARAALANRPGLALRLETRDILENPPDEGEYDLVVLFGVLHHVPGRQTRLDLVRRLAARVRPGGLLAFACWRFYEYARYRARFAPWPEGLTVETHDYLLDWRRGQPALRYCHYVDDAEHAALVAASGLQQILTYRADGEDGAANRYSLLQK